MDPKSGMFLNERYRLDAELGRGGMGVVYRAHDTLLDRPVAVKVVSGSDLGTEGRARLLREARAAARLNHPNIVSVHDAGEADGVLFIVMELVEGESLFSRKPQSVAEILSISRQVCAALDHAHAHAIVHRDLKPENVLIGSNGSVKLMDFGLARPVASRLTTEGTLVGTVFYIAPEQALGQEIDGRADLYALGVMLYELTTGRLPFTGDDPLAVISQHLHAPLVPPRAYNPQIPAPLDGLIVRLLHKQPEGRPATAAEVRQTLEHLDLAATSAPEEELSLLDRIVRGRLVGRERELAEAEAHWRRAASGEGQVLLVSGEPGVGKTRLVRELAAQAQVMGARLLTAECYAEGGAPYGPVAQIIREALGAASDGLSGLPEYVLADLITLVPALRVRYAHVPPNPELEPEAQQERLYESLVSLITALQASAPAFLFLDDAHWADSGTLFLLRHLARRTRKLRLLIVLTYREVELDEARALNDVLLDLNRERLATRLKLSRLSRDQTRDLLAAMFAEEITPEFLDGIYRETEGNPFFIEEVCKALIEEGKLYREGGRWRRPNMEEINVPQSVRLAIQARVSKLPPVAQDVLRLAAVLGREFDFETLLRASELDEEALIEALENAGRAQLLSESHRGGRVAFAFAHALMPATLRESVSGLRRQRLHRRVAAAIESLRPDDFEALAHHFAAAGEPHKAVEYSRHAARRAEALYAYDEAVRHLQNALDLVPDDQVESRLAVPEQLADIHRLLRAGARAIPLYQEALGLWEKLPGADKTILVRLHRKIVEAGGRLALFADRQRFEAAFRASSEAALKLTAGEPPHPETVRLLTTLSRDAWSTRIPPDWDGAEQYARAAVAMAEHLDAPVELSAALDSLASVYGGRGLFRERVQVALRRLALSQDPRFADLRERVNILHQAGAALMYVGEYAQAMPHLLEAESLGSRIRDVDQQVAALRYQSQCHYQLDNWDGVLAIEAKWQALEQRDPNFLDRVGAMCFQLALNASVHARRGEFEQARVLRERSLARMTAAEGPPERWSRANHY